MRRTSQRIIVEKFRQARELNLPEVDLSGIVLHSNILSEIEFSSFVAVEAVAIGGPTLMDFPAALLELPNLKSIALERSFVSAIPDLTAASKLEQLIISNNSYLGELPNSIGMLRKLKFLICDGNAVRQVPKNILSGPELRVASFADSLLERFFVDEICSPVFRELNLSGNRLQQFPESACSCSSLRLLNVGRNLIQSVPAEISHLGMLTWFSISDNYLRDLPSQVVDCENLLALEIARNRFLSFPSVVYGIRRLRRLVIAGNSDISDEELKTFRNDYRTVDGLPLNELVM